MSAVRFALLVVPLLCWSSAAGAVEVLETTDAVIDDVIGQGWLNPGDPFWKPRRGERWELAAYVGGEASLTALSPDKLPTIGGVVVDGIVRYYPLSRATPEDEPDRLAVIGGFRAYLGLDGVPASGTTASTVVTMMAGVRYDLVRENRFSLNWDLYSGPSIYGFANLDTDDGLSANTPTYSIGGEMGTALALRYTLGPITGEMRGLVGGRAGASQNSLARGDVVGSGPFSSLYGGVDFGVTWSL
ncbi:MAG TPA: hypothetical protein VGF99_14125 [Myxococcota bacterium]